MRRFDKNPWQTEWGSGIDKNDSDNDDYCDAEEALAEIERLRAAILDAIEAIDKIDVTMHEGYRTRTAARIIVKALLKKDE